MSEIIQVMKRKNEESFGQKLIRMRKVRGLSQLQLSEVSGVCRGTIRAIERDTSGESMLRGRLETYIRLARVFGVSIDELLRGHLPRVNV